MLSEPPSLILRLGELTGTPKTSRLHIHPVRNNTRDLGGNDAEISKISSVQTKKIYNKIDEDRSTVKKANGEGWHSDVAYEPVPASYTSLRLSELPSTGGGENILFLFLPTKMQSMRIPGSNKG